ncbi:glycosyl hydrolase [Photobacterium sanctipauli]|uniref:Glycosyl hydrolase n=1 Tax=Photobacterium sanctipauli TaxID=1342794 RepID=A0A2T3P1D9_9GAMM|nr:glycoside hydrolase [Photobacterium sanctipauli]PSW22320.1 glycosyl hydrolase [Photobacterium sanctipauli]
MSLYNKSVPWLVAAASIFSLSANADEQVNLAKHNEAVSISAETLAITWNELEVNQANLLVNGEKQQVTNLTRVSSTESTWTLQPADIDVTAQLTDVLTLTFTANSSRTIKRGEPWSLAWFDLPEQTTDTLYLPFSEGMKVPTDHPVWAQYLTRSYSGANTTQELKMPFWSTRQNGTYITYHLVTPTNNQLDFESSQYENNKLNMLASHDFTKLNKAQPFVVRISLGEDNLAGARTYRQWRLDNGLATPLVEKMQATPRLEKLVGASHVYLFGRGLIDVADVQDWWGLKDWYLNDSGLHVPEQDKKQLAALKKGAGWFSKYEKQLLVDSINSALVSESPTPRPQMKNNGIEAQFMAAQERKAWLAQHAGRFLINEQRWGQALTQDMVDTLQDAGLSKMWLGFDNWMPAFYQPDAVEQAKSAGYLVGTYDSYNTAIAQGVNDNWMTAQLPDEIRMGCAIELADGSLQSGFRGNGYYLNPNCQRDYVEQRIKDIVKFGRFDSLFLDVDAVAMAREDYRDGTSEQALLDAYNSRLQWIPDNLPVVLGSEDGNSLTTAGIAFAHGMETVGFGWLDKDMKENKDSPYYLGRWYPDHKPDFFFKSAEVKEPYKTLFFDPQYRIPLYQAVFHDEVINSHHWHSDSLKFSDVKADRDLVGMLYNTPAMVHLARSEVTSKDSPRIKALQHYQQGFQPIHNQLWNKALVKFEWLSDDGLLQQTTYSDGSTIIANFKNDSVTLDEVTIPAKSIKAALANGEEVNWQAE